MDYFVEVVEEDAKAKPETVINKEVVEAWITLQSVWRSRGDWPLVGFSYFQDLKDRLKNVNIDVWGLVPAPHFRGRRRDDYRENLPEDDRASPEKVALFRLNSMFPHLQEILDMGQGKLLVSGGSVVRSLMEDLNSRYQETDADLFFYGVNEREAEELLERIVESLCKDRQCATLSRAGEYYDSDSSDDEARRAKDQRVSLLRSGHMVQVRIFDSRWHSWTYQFVLRLHSSPQQVLGATDLSCCGIGYSPSLGLIMTPSAAFSLATRTIIADPLGNGSRSYESRLTKYVDRGFAVLLPSLGAFSSAPPPPDEQRPPRGRGRGRMTIKPEVSLGDRRKGMTIAREVQNADRRNFQNVSHRLLETIRPESESDYGTNTEEDIGTNNICMINMTGGDLDFVLLSGSTFKDLLWNPVAFGEKQMEELYNYTSLTVAFAQKIYGPDTLQFCDAWLNGDYAALEVVNNRTKQRILSVLQTAMETRKGLRWVVANSGISGSFRPRPIAPRQWYPPDMYVPSYSGLPVKYAPTLRLLRRFHPGWASLPNDVLRLLMRYYIIPAIAWETINTLIRSADLPDPSTTPRETTDSEQDWSQ